MCVLAVVYAAGARAQGPVRFVALEAGDFADAVGTHVECAAMWTGKSRTLVGMFCYERPKPGFVGAWAPYSYQVGMRLDGRVQLEGTKGLGIESVPVFSHPSGTSLGGFDTGGIKGAKSYTVPLGAGFELGQTPLHCTVATLGIAAPGERGVACAFATAAGTPRPNSYGIAISDLAAYVAFVDASGHVSVGLSRRQPRR